MYRLPNARQAGWTRSNTQGSRSPRPEDTRVPAPADPLHHQTSLTILGVLLFVVAVVALVARALYLP